MGFPIRKSPVITLLVSLPRLIADLCVLLRLKLPSHPPTALRTLTTSNENKIKMVFSYSVFKVQSFFKFRIPIKHYRTNYTYGELAESMVDLRRFELLTSSLQMRRSSQLSYRPKDIINLLCF